MVSYHDEELQGPIDSQAPAKKNKTIPKIIFSLAILSVVAVLISDVESLSFSSDSRRMLEADPKPTGKVRRGTEPREAANKPEADPKPTGEVRRLKKALPPPSSSVSSANKPGADSKGLEGSPVMHTFFEVTDKPCCGMSNEGHLNLVKAWEKSWQDRGWITKVLTKEDAMKHPEFEALSQKLSALNVDAYNQRCFWRWMAMVGTSTGNGGWMSDYDTFPLGFSAEEGLEIAQRPGFKTFGRHVPNIIHAPSDAWDRVLHALFEVMPESTNNIDKDYDKDHEECPYITDMCMLLYAQKKFGIKAIGITYWEHESVDGFVYNTMDDKNQPLEIDCSYADRFKVAHLSHASLGKAFNEKHNYPRLDGIGDGSLVERRHEAALVMMEDFRKSCLEPNSSATKKGDGILASLA